MRNLLTFVFLTVSVSSFGQTYQGTYGKYSHNWLLKIYPDSSIIIEQDNRYGSYEEYAGTLRKLNDTLFAIKARLVFAQNKARAIGDSLIYIRMDSAIQKDIQNIMLTYFNGNMITIPTNWKSIITIPIDKKLFNSESEKNIFFLSAGHLNPIDKTEIKTEFKIGEEYCIEFFTGWEEIFNVVIKNNKLTKTGKGHIDNFVLKMEQ
jgi:hypothetical protein